MIPALIALGGSLLGGIFGNRSQQQKQFSRSNSQQISNWDNNQNSQFWNRSNPLLDQQIMGLRNDMIGAAQNRLSSPMPQRTGTDFFDAYQANAMRTANNAARLRTQQAINNASARGLGNSTMAGYAHMGAEADRIAEMGNILTQMPLLRRQIGREDDQLMEQFASGRLGDAVRAFSSVPYGQENEGGQASYATGGSDTRSSQMGENINTMPGNMVGGGINSLASMLSFLLGNGYNWGDMWGRKP